MKIFDRPHLLLLAKGLWLALAALAIGLWVLGSAELLFGPIPDCTNAICDNMEFSAGDLPTLRRLNLGPTFIRLWSGINLVSSLFAFGMAFLIFARRSDDRMGYLISFALIYMGAILFTTSDDPLKRAYPQLLPFITLIDVFGLLSFVAVLLIFPDGLIAHRRSAIFGSILIVVFMSIPLLGVRASRLQTPEVHPLIVFLWLLMFISTVGIAIYGQVHRYRHVSDLQQRQQTKWVVFGMFGLFFTPILWSYIGFAHQPDAPSSIRILLVIVTIPAISFAAALLPAGVAFSILRYRLFDIDRLINKTLVYGALSVSLIALYFVSIVVFQRLIPGESQLAIVLSTLTIAFLFNPLKNRFQQSIDRRFYRQQYDSAKILSDFSHSVRDEVDLERITRELERAVGQAMQPEHVSLWLREEPVRSRVLQMADENGS